MTWRRSKRMGIEKFGNVMNQGGGSIIILSIIEAAHWEAFCIALLFFVSCYESTGYKCMHCGTRVGDTYFWRVWRFFFFWSQTGRHGFGSF